MTAAIKKKNSNYEILVRYPNDRVMHCDFVVRMITREKSVVPYTLNR